MRILFLYVNPIDPHKGGIQRVTSVLSHYFLSQGHEVYFLSTMIGGTKNENGNQFYLPNSNDVVCDLNIQYFKDFVGKRCIDIVINQSGMDPKISKLAYYTKETNAKLISCIHNSLLSQIEYFEATYEFSARKYHLSFLLPLTKLKFIKNFLFFLYRLKYTNHYTNLSNWSDKIVLLSMSFREDLKFFIKSNSYVKEKIIAISNPTSFSEMTYDIGRYRGSKQLLYVGRIDRRQKRVDLLLDIWEKLHNRYVDWSLKVVGGGADLHLLIDDAKKRNLRNISFEGFKDPVPYYLNSSIFCMTSSYEGFGIVLAEAMSFGLVPVAFKSYSSVTDIIDNDDNGFLVTPFNLEEYALKLSDLMDSFDLRFKIGENAKLKSRQFSVEVIGETWNKFFREITSQHF